jgi:hypothetical protein
MASSPQMQEAQRQMVARAIDIAKDHSFTLDFSEPSIATVDDVLMKVHQAFVKDTDKEAHTYALMGVAIAFGAYIIEVIERAYGKGEWRANTSRESERSAYPYSLGGFTIYPVDWCSDAITIGKAEKVLVKYKAFTESLPSRSV